jgi:hypothetical protein
MKKLFEALKNILLQSHPLFRAPILQEKTFHSRGEVSSSHFLPDLFKYLLRHFRNASVIGG